MEALNFGRFIITYPIGALLGVMILMMPYHAPIGQPSLHGNAVLYEALHRWNGLDLGVPWPKKGPNHSKFPTSMVSNFRFQIGYVIVTWLQARFQETTCHHMLISLLDWSGKSTGNSPYLTVFNGKIDGFRWILPSTNPLNRPSRCW